MGGATEKIAEWKSIRWGAEAELWNQPSYGTGAGAIAQGVMTTGALRGFLIDVGFKTKGQWPGRPAKSGPILRGGYRSEILRKIWFDRADLQVSRLQSFGPKGILLSDVHVADWQPVLADQAASGSARPVPTFPRQIRIERPHDDYRLDLQITKATLNEDLPPDRFKLEQAPGSELVRVGENTDEKPR